VYDAARLSYRKNIAGIDTPDTIQVSRSAAIHRRPGRRAAGGNQSTCRKGKYKSSDCNRSYFTVNFIVTPLITNTLENATIIIVYNFYDFSTFDIILFKNLFRNYLNYRIHR
jgi:hypothetical protein